MTERDDMNVHAERPVPVDRPTSPFAPSKHALSRSDRRRCDFAVVAALSWMLLAGVRGRAEDVPSPANAPQEAVVSDAIDAAELPWKRHGQAAPPAPDNDIDGPRQLLELYGIDASHLNNLVDGEALGDADEETLVKLLYRMPRVPLDALQGWSAELDVPSQLVDRPSAYRGGVFSLKGRAKFVQPVALLPEIADRFEFDHYYRVTLDLAEAPFSIVLCTREIPAAWPKEQAIDERSGATGFFLKVADTSGSQPNLVLAAPRAAWYPDRATPLAVESDALVLADLGMDVGLFDAVRDGNRRPLRSEDRECFYQLLATLGRAPPEFSQPVTKPVDLAGVLQDPESRQGQLMTVAGIARRVTKIQVPDKDVRARFGIDHYYQIDIFLPLGDEIIRLGESSPDKESPTFTNSFPVTVCVLDLPEDLPVGNDLREDVRVPAAFFKIWAYRSEFVASFDDQQLQVGPMFVGHLPRVTEQLPTRQPYLGLAAGLLFLVALAGLWIGFIRWSQSDRAFQGKRRQRNFGTREP